MLKRLLSFTMALALATPVLSGEVMLTSHEGTMTISGDFLSRDGELFRINTKAGSVTIDAGMFNCSGEGCPDPAEMVARGRIGGSPEFVHRLLPALLEVFADTLGLDQVRNFSDDTTVFWDLRKIGSDRLVASIEGRILSTEELAKNLVSGEIDLGFARSELAHPIRQDVVALDALVPAVAPDNLRAMVTVAQLNGLLNGEISNWSRLGGPNSEVKVFLPQGWDAEARRLHRSGEYSEITRMNDLSVLADAVAASSQTLGLLPFSSMGNAVPLVVSGACGLATPATRDTIRAEDYPITQPVFLQRFGARQPKIIREFVAFARASEAQAVIQAAGFVDQSIGRIGFERQGDRIANAVLATGNDPDEIAEVQRMIGELLNAERLTLTFRFRDGSSDLDPQSASNIQRLADAVSDGNFEGYEVLFVGFSDTSGAKDANLRLSERRARSVRSAVAARVANASVPLNVAAFGELMPMACEDTPWGGQVNRRVEVWVRPL